MSQAAQAHVVAARDLTPSDTAGLHDGGVLAFVTEEGGRTSHSAIMARSLDVPAVVGVKGLMEAVQEGDVILVDGESGLIIINPTGTGNFVGNTTPLDDGTVAPNAAYVNNIGPFDPTVLLS